MPLTVAVKLICHLLVAVAGREGGGGGGGAEKKATHTSLYRGANFPLAGL